MQNGKDAFDVIGETLDAAYSCHCVENKEDARLDRRVETLLAFLRKIHRRKTGALIVASLKLGAFTARANSEQLATLTRYGEVLGQAFQIADDLLDAVGDETKLGKRAHKDSASGKLTYVSLLGVDEARRRLDECVVIARRALEEREAVFVNSLHNSLGIALALPEYLAKRQR